MKELPPRRDPRTESTRAALIEAAETLFGELGFEAVTTKQIGSAIGSANKTVVAYHFGSKIDLVNAIYHERFPAIEQRRGELLAEVDGGSQSEDLEALLKVLWQPLVELTNSRGVHGHARFLARMLQDDDLELSRRMVQHISPMTRGLVYRISAHLPVGPGPFYNLRWQLATRLILDAIVFMDLNAQWLSGPAEHAQIFDDALAMAKAAMTAPRRPVERPAAEDGFRAARAAGNAR